MNKTEFSLFIKEKLNGLSLERQIKELEKIKDVYLPKLIQQLQKELGTWVDPKKRNEYMFCEKCRKYSLKKKCKFDLKEEVRTITTYTDAAYGEGDKEGDVLYGVEYHVCPRCGHKQETNKHFMRIIREWYRRDGRR